ncbi:ExbD/TolR family protein [Permianibacter aggregans]|uniref:Outer membrane transport energization protein ExbD n=1 Tax=Permianibacter aggregans TaxID=1510150 RepID=A0A4R6UQ79_9GAMM|nr:biopolymer transporter ExbD [Permianibacter aggregans]QGX40462.1 biopolymer transporter ExbD [Permianibacter aggregans]TDQ49398.1 outer membrane transport energization protein ExbD [Permianibacter aggregans]
MRKKHTGIAEEAEVDMTPMLDIVFIMLIFFIVTTTFTKEAGLEIQRPSGKTATTTKVKANVLITITSDDQIVINDRIADVRTVRANVERVLAEAPDAAVIVQSHEGANTDTLVQVVNAAKEAGIDKVSVGTYN